MVGDTLDFILQFKDDGALAKIRETEEASGKLKVAATGVMGAFRDVQAVMQGPIAAYKEVKQKIDEVVAVAADLVNEYGNAEQASLKLSAAVKQNATMGSSAVDELSAFADQIQAHSIFEADDTKAIIANAAAMGMSKKQIMDLLNAATGLSSATGQSLQTSFEQLNATLQGNAGILGRQNSAVMALTEEQLKHGDAIKIVQQQYGYMTDVVANSTLGELKRLDTSFKDLKEDAGGIIAGFIRPFVEGLDEVAKGIDSAIKERERLAGVKSGSVAATKDDINNQLKLVAAAKQQLALFEQTYSKSVDQWKTDKNALQIATDLGNEYALQYVALQQNLESQRDTLSLMQRKVDATKLATAAEREAAEVAKQKADAEDKRKAYWTWLEAEYKKTNEYQHQALLIERDRIAANLSSSNVTAAEADKLGSILAMLNDQLGDTKGIGDAVDTQAQKQDLINEKLEHHKDLQEEGLKNNKVDETYQDLINEKVYYRAKAQDAVNEKSDLEDKILAKIYEEMKDGIAGALNQGAIDTAVSGFEAIGSALVSGKDAGEAFKNAILSGVANIASQISSYEIMAGLRLIIEGQTWIGLGLIALGGITGIASGIMQASGSTTASAQGNVFENGHVRAFANGEAFTNSIATSPTYFDTGLMGEDGPEAIMPLDRMSDGSLGVRTEGSSSSTVVNIHNYSGQQVKTKTSSDGTSQQLDVIIGSMVDKNIAIGRHDKALMGRYRGISRQVTRG